jgi:hypothetical protein
MPSFLSVLLGKVKSTYSNYPALISIGVFLVVAFFYSLVYLDNSGISTIDDHFFYFEYAKMVKNEGWDGVKTFEGGYLTKKENGQSKFGLSLFNIVNIPFTYIKNEIDGLKLSDIFVASSALALFYYVLRKAKINYPLFFTFFLIVSPFFMHRLLMGRPYVLTTSLIFLEIFLASRKEYRILFLVTLVHLFWHNSTFWLPLVMVGAVEMARFLVVQKFFYKNIFAVSVATILGMAFLPNFFNLWTWLRTIFIVQEGIMDNSLKVSGVELQTSDAFSGRFIGIDIFFIVAVASITIVIFLYLRQRKILSDDMKRDSALAEYYIMAYASFIFFLIVVFGTMIISGRFYDYYQTTLVFLFAVVVTILQKERLIIFKDVLHKYIIVGSTVFILLVLDVLFLPNELQYQNKINLEYC